MRLNFIERIRLWWFRRKFERQMNQYAKTQGFKNWHEIPPKEPIGQNLWPDTGTLRRGIPLPKAGQKATRQDVGKFMKHGHQAPWYRKSVKAKIQPDEEED